MSDRDDLDDLDAFDEDLGDTEDLADLDIDDERVLLDDEESELDRTRTAYSGANLRDEFQPVDEVELAEEGMLLDDPEHPNRRRKLDADDEGWDLDAEG